LQFIALFALVAVASAQHYNNDYYQPQYQQYQSAPALIKTVQPALIKTVQPALIKQVQPAYVKHIEHEEPANYEFNYDVHDHHTGDIKQQHETAKDGAISGQYSLIDADGYRRTVTYTADDHHGFNAEVRREPVEGHKVVKAVKVVQQPIIQKYVAQPQQHYYQQAQPQQHYYQQAPQAQYYQAPAQQYYQAPAQVKVVAPVVQKYVAAPVVQKYVAPVVEKYVHAAPVVQKVIAAPAVKYTSAEHSAHVSFNGPQHNYHY